jgi:hypothetical protein
MTSEDEREATNGLPSSPSKINPDEIITIDVGDVYQGSPVEDVDEAYVAPNFSAEDTGRLLMLVVSLGLFAATLLVAFSMLPFVTNTTWDRIQALLSAIIPVETLMIGAAASYYYKTEAK